MSTSVFLTVFLALIGFAVLVMVAGWLAAKPVHAACLALCMIVLEAANLPLSIEYGIWLYPADLFFAVLALSCLGRFSLFASFRKVPAGWWVIGAVQLLLLLWGYRMFGSRAGVDYRVHFYLWMSVCYFCSVEWTEPMVERVLTAWTLCASALCLLTFYRWIGSAVDPDYAKEIMGLDTTGVRFRVVSASSSLVIAVGFLILLFRLLRSSLPFYQRCMLPVYLLTVVVLQHRSVWVSLFVGVVCLVWIARKGEGGARGLLGIGLLVIPLAIVAAIPDGDNSVVSSIKTAAGSAVSTKEGTMVARMENWQDLLANWSTSKNAVTYLIGMPYGSGYNPMESEDGEEMFDMVPHNHFVHILYRGGLIALCATLVLFYRLVAAAITSARNESKPLAPCFAAIFGAFAAFFIPYWATYGCGILIGVAISYLGIHHIAPHAVRAYQKYEIRGRQ